MRILLLLLVVSGAVFSLEIQSRQEFVVQLRDATVDPAMFAHKHQLEYLGPVTTLEGNYHRFLPKQGTRNTIEDRDGQAIWMERQEPRQQSTRSHVAPKAPHVVIEEEMRKRFEEEKKKAQEEFAKVKFNGPSMQDILYAANHPEEAMQKHREAVEKQRLQLLQKNVRGQQTPQHHESDAAVFVAKSSVVVKHHEKNDPPAPRSSAGDNLLKVSIDNLPEATPEMMKELKEMQKTPSMAPPRGAIDGASDPLYTQQWHLPVIHAADAWKSGVKGKGVVIAIVDDGLQHSHDDLRGNYEPRFSRDYNDGDSDPSPGYSDNHGTSCAGVAAATANNTHCGSGAAPLAKLVGRRLIAAPSTDYQEAMALSQDREHVDIFSNSWGPADTGMDMAGPGRLTLEALAQGAQYGRGGKGSIFVWASGNGRHVGDSCAYDGYASSPYTIAVGALDSNGKQSYYSEGCAALLCVTPSSGSSATQRITTTDISTPGLGYDPSSECTSSFGGTSSAAPLAAGIIALALESNPELGWREVQLLIAKSAVGVDVSADWSVSNGRGFRHSHRYGFGLLDAKAMVEMAKRQPKLPAQKGFSSGVIQVYLAIPGDGTPTCVAHKFARSGINYVEHVLLRVGLRHPRRGQIRVTLKSPEGITSILADQHPDPHANYPQNGWLFSTVRHFGERAADGDWQICVSDTVNDYYTNGVFDFFELATFGHYEQ